ncbi:long-chain fatty acid transport protein [Nitrosospira sp. Nl5]|uniref:OmpP1/FadL family transporter n=1 Tax=Nitrosospira sp. Nl5 TaxID=200120 RepID=UPI00088873E7|nr:outer membrane protein transport protein [Nitrosospira sp. Nl5]SCY28457.1 long-chain fatty acid transport protein [Nitrosospira sp. Nl5]
MYHPLALLVVLQAMSWIFAASHAAASGFAILNQNGSGAGYAYAGAAAAAQDASTIFFNPAGMTYLTPGHHFSGALSVPISSLRFKDTGSTVFPGSSVGDNGGHGGGVAIIPTGYWSMSINHALRLGLGLSPTFGSITDWSKTFIGRYQGTSSEITGINANPSIAWRMNNVVSLGAGFNIVGFDADLRGMAPVAAPIDPRTKLTGRDIGFGYNLGAMLQVTPATRLGITYRSSIDLNVDGHFQGLGSKIPASASIKLPDTISVAISHMFNAKLQLLADFTWTGWSSIPALMVESRIGGATLLNERLGFKDSCRLGFGAQYQYNDGLRLKMGVAYDQSPIRNAMDRTVRLPDSDRTLLAVGINQKISQRTSVDFGYIHVFLEKSEIDRPTGNPLLLPVVRGSFSSSADIVSVQLNHQF